MINSAFWEFADASRQACLWHIDVPLEDATLDLDLELAEHGWRLFDVLVDPALEFVLPGQLLRTRALKRAGNPLAETYVAECDYAQALATQVALAFPPPVELMAALDDQQIRVRVASLLPPSTLGLFGVVFSERARWVYPLRYLDATAHQLQAELAEVLRRLTEDDYQRCSARYKHAQACAFQLAVCYQEYHQQSTLSRAASHRPSGTWPEPSLPLLSTGHAPAKAVVVPPLFAQGPVLIPAVLPVRATFVATVAPPQKWKASMEGIPIFPYQQEEGTTLVEIRPKQLAQMLDEEVLARLWQIAKDLTPLEGFLFLALLGFVRSTSPDEAGNHYVTAERLLEARSILPKSSNGKYRATDFTRIATAMDRLNAIWLQVDPDITMHPLSDAEPIQELWSRRSKLLHIDRVRLRTRVWPGITTTQLVSGDTAAASPRSLPVAWDFHFGGWLAPFMQAPSRQMVRIDQASLSYHLSDKLWEGLLLQYITFHARTHRRGPLHLQVGTLFDELSLPINPRHPQNALDRFHQALKCLVKDGHCVEATPNYDESRFPEHHWVEDYWFKSTVTFLLHSPE